jgi:O-acetyl-ADP-ribose deacetylase (regulator of RNase III)
VTPGSISSYASVSKTFFSGALKTSNIIALVVGGVVLVGTIIAIAVLVSNHAKQVAGQTDKPIKKADEEKIVVTSSTPNALPYWMWIIVGGVGLVACVIIGVSLGFHLKKSVNGTGDHTANYKFVYDLPDCKDLNLTKGAALESQEAINFAGRFGDGFIPGHGRNFHLFLDSFELKSLPLNFVCVSVYVDQYNNESVDDSLFGGFHLSEHFHQSLEMVSSLSDCMEKRERVLPGSARVITAPSIEEQAKTTKLLKNVKYIIVVKGQSESEDEHVRETTIRQAYWNVLSKCKKHCFQHVAMPIIKSSLEPGRAATLALETINEWFNENPDSLLTVFMVVPENLKADWIDKAGKVGKKESA